MIFIPVYTSFAVRVGWKVRLYSRARVCSKVLQFVQHKTFPEGTQEMAPGANSNHLSCSLRALTKSGSLCVQLYLLSSTRCGPVEILIVQPLENKALSLPRHQGFAQFNLWIALLSPECLRHALSQTKVWSLHCKLFQTLSIGSKH